MNLEDGHVPDIDLDTEELDIPERWIISKLQSSVQNYNRQLDRFHFNEAAKVLYDFTWNDFCDWYIEIAKTRFYGNNAHAADVSRSVAIHVLKTVLTILHPYAPFISEELWAQVKGTDDQDLIIHKWPEIEIDKKDDVAEKKMELLQEIITGIRTVRSRMNIPPGKKIRINRKVR